MRFARPARILQALARISNPRVPWPVRRDRPVKIGPLASAFGDFTLRWRALVTTTVAEELERCDGFGLAPLEELVNFSRIMHQAELAAAVAEGEDAADFAAAAGDQVVWDGNRVIAVLRVLPDGSLEDNRFTWTGFLIGPSGSAREKGGW